MNFCGFYYQGRCTFSLFDAGDVLKISSQVMQIHSNWVPNCLICRHLPVLLKLRKPMAFQNGDTFENHHLTINCKSQHQVPCFVTSKCSKSQEIMLRYKLRRFMFCAWTIRSNYQRHFAPAIPKYCYHYLPH